MIRDKRIIISLGIILVLFLYLLISSRDKKSGDIPRVRPFKSADEILLIKNDKQIRIYSKDNKWFINQEGYPADKSKIDKLEKDMKELTITDFISRGPYYIKYDLTPEKAIRATFKKEGKIERDVLIGKASSTFRNTYIKFADSDKIYLASGNLNDEFNKEVEDFRDKQIYKVNKDDIERFELVYQGNKLDFEKKIELIDSIKDAAKDNKEAKEKDGQKAAKKEKIEKWVCTEFRNADIDKNKVDSFLTSVASINADSYPNVNKKDLKGLICSLKGKVYNKEIELVIHKKEGENYLCSSSESPYAFSLQEYNAKKFFKKITDFEADKKNNNNKGK